MPSYEATLIFEAEDQDAAEMAYLKMIEVVCGVDTEDPDHDCPFQMGSCLLIQDSNSDA